MSLIAWWKNRIGRRNRRCGERARLRDAHRFGQELARNWLTGRGSVVRSLAPGAGDSLVAAAFRHGLLEGNDIHEAEELAQAVLSGMADAARSSSRGSRARSRLPAASNLAAAEGGVSWMAEQVLRDADADFALGRAVIEKVRSWSLERPFPARRNSRPSVAGRR